MPWFAATPKHVRSGGLRIAVLRSTITSLIDTTDPDSSPVCKKEGATANVADAVNLFIREQISGAPVVDETGVCIGVLSATDLVSFEEKREKTPTAGCKASSRPFDSWAWGADWWSQFGKINSEIQPLEEPVSAYMTRDLVSVAEDTPLGTLLRMMVDAHVHRVIVLDSSRRLRGIVTTMDVLAAALRAGRREQVASGA
jgi:CBS domain-containing protein